MSTSQPNPIPDHLLPGYDPVFSTIRDLLYFKQTLQLEVDSSKGADVECHTRKLEEISQCMSDGLTRNPNWLVGIEFQAKALGILAGYKKLAGPV